MRAFKAVLLLATAMLMLVQTGAPAGASAATEPFSFAWQGSPPSPQPWTPEDWDLIVHSRDRDTWAQIEPMQAQHGADCSPYPATHMVSTYEDSVYVCKNHLMTAINGGGYGAIYLAPNRMVDFSGGTASIQYHVSTMRTSQRDWHDIWVTPFDDNLVLPLYRFPDLQGPPRNAVHIQLVGDNSFIGNVFRNFVNTDLPRQQAAPYDRFLGPSAITRSDFELDISRTHIRFGMPQFQVWWIDTDIPDLGWSQGVVQLGHHSYNPTKAENGTPGTWHWSDFSMSSTVRFTMLRGSIQSIHDGTSPLVCFSGSAPAQGYLRFAAIGHIEVSFDAGRHFAPATLAAQVGPHYEGAPIEGLFASYWMPVPAGASSVVFRGTDWWGGQWWVRDPSIWSRSTDPVAAPKACPKNVITGSTGTGSTTSAPAAATASGKTDDMPWLASVENRLRRIEYRVGRRNLEVMIIAVAAVGIIGAVALGFGLGRRRRRVRQKN